MKICSLLPSATEILFALGLGDQVAGVSHECDFPPEARSKPILIKSRVSLTESAAEIDRQVRGFLERGESLYSVDFDVLAAIEPDVIVTQDLCHVCAATPDDLAAALAHLRRQPRVITLNPHSLADVCADIRTVGEATRALRAGERGDCGIRMRMWQTWNAPLPVSSVRVLYASNGSIRPTPRDIGCQEMVERAGGIDVLGQAGNPSSFVWNGTRSWQRSLT